MSLSIKQHTKNKVEILKISGFMDMVQVPFFEKTLNNLLQSGKNNIVLDFSELEYLCSGGLGTILGCIQQAREKDGDIVIGGLNAIITDIFDETGFGKILNLTDTAEQAILLFKQ